MSVRPVEIRETGELGCKRYNEAGTQADEKRKAAPHIELMSRAFVNEDHFVDDLPDRPVSPHPNYVTERGLQLIEASLEEARRVFGEAQAVGDREALAKARRDLRYWTARRASAIVTPVKPGSDAVQFGNLVTIARDDGREQTFRIVGEDEADPAQGSISHVSPLARALIGRRVGDIIRAGKDEAEITAIG
jgi:transcription elongation GreA/GreB family factor